MSDIIEKGQKKCAEGTGMLPRCAPLANAYVPMQGCSMPQYEAGEAMARGTLFPGLDLPFMGMVNNDFPITPLSELMTLDFVVHELGLYLDTHKTDEEAFNMYQNFLELQMEGHERYVEQFGPVQKTDMISSEKFDWLKCPWPWEYDGVEEE